MTRRPPETKRPLFDGTAAEEADDEPTVGTQEGGFHVMTNLRLQTAMPDVVEVFLGPDFALENEEQDDPPTTPDEEVLAEHGGMLVEPDGEEETQHDDGRQGAGELENDGDSSFDEGFDDGFDEDLEPTALESGALVQAALQAARGTFDGAAGEPTLQQDAFDGGFDDGFDGGFDDSVDEWSFDLGDLNFVSFPVVFGGVFAQLSSAPLPSSPFVLGAERPAGSVPGQVESIEPKGPPIVRRLWRASVDGHSR